MDAKKRTQVMDGVREMDEWCRTARSLLNNPELLDGLREIRDNCWNWSPYAVLIDDVLGPPAKAPESPKPNPRKHFPGCFCGPCQYEQAKAHREATKKPAPNRISAEHEAIQHFTYFAASYPNGITRLVKFVPHKDMPGGANAGWWCVWTTTARWGATKQEALDAFLASEGAR